MVQVNQSQHHPHCGREVIQDLFSQRLLRAAAPPDIKVEIMDAEGGAEYLRQNELASQKIILLTKVPQVMEELISRGVEITSINLGGMGAKTGRRQLTKTYLQVPKKWTVSGVLWTTVLRFIISWFQQNVPLI